MRRVNVKFKDGRGVERSFVVTLEKIPGGFRARSGDDYTCADVSCESDTDKKALRGVVADMKRYFYDG